MSHTAVETSLFRQELSELLYEKFTITSVTETEGSACYLVGFEYVMQVLHAGYKS